MLNEITRRTFRFSFSCNLSPFLIEEPDHTNTPEQDEGFITLVLSPSQVLKEDDHKVDGLKQGPEKKKGRPAFRMSTFFVRRTAEGLEHATTTTCYNGTHDSSNVLGIRGVQILLRKR